jgi:phosphoglycerate dehydrogenase-like enzyme
MRNSIIMASAAALLTTSLAIPLTPADAKQRAGEWRGKDGRLHCRRRNGTIGLVVGGVGGALVGRAIDTRGDRAVGTVVGAGAGALLGREVARGRHCR